MSLFLVADRAGNWFGAKKAAPEMLLVGPVDSRFVD
jgi:hypothetical protein